MDNGKIDFYKLYKDEYMATTIPQLVDVKPATFLAVDGEGEFGTEQCYVRMTALYNVVLTIKAASKLAGQDYAFYKLEGFWWGTDSQKHFLVQPSSDWRWRLAIRTPEFITQKVLDEDISVLQKKGKGFEVAEVKLDQLEEGLCAQMLHIGPNETKMESLAVLQQFAESFGYTLDGRHHEIYLTDFKMIPPSRWRTILRVPVKSLK